MPLYEYRCRKCGHVFEQFVRTLFSQPRPVCPRCGSEQADKVVSMVGSTRSGEAGASAANCAPSGG